MVDIMAYSTIIFDCDGVLLNSNDVKTEGFRKVSLPFGKDASDALVAYHIKNGGVSRFKKLSYFRDEILPYYLSGQVRPELDVLISSYESEVQEGLMTCSVEGGLSNLRALTAGSRWVIVSGGQQDELRQVFSARNLANFFDGGIFGSPETKDEIFLREIENGNIRFPAVYIGDSRYDYTSATTAGLDFIFSYGWTEFVNWEEFFLHRSVPVIENLTDLASDRNIIRGNPP